MLMPSKLLSMVLGVQGARPALLRCSIAELGHADVAPAAGHLHVGLVHEPAVADHVSATPRRVDHGWCEALHPAEQRDVVDLDVALGEQLFEVPVGQTEP